MSGERAVPELSSLSSEVYSANANCSIEDPVWLSHVKPCNTGVNFCDVDLPTMSALEVDAILDGLSSTVEYDDTRLNSILNSRSSKSTDNLSKIPLTIEQHSPLRTENVAKLRTSHLGGSIDSGLDGKTTDARLVTSQIPVHSATFKRANSDCAQQSNIVNSIANCVSGTKQKEMISLKKTSPPWLCKSVVAADSSQSFQVSKMSDVTLDAASLRDRSPIGTLDLATKPGFRPASLNKIGSREANWAIRLAGLSRSQNTKTKVISILHRPVSLKSDASLKPISTTSTVPQVALVKPPHQSVTTQGYFSSGCDDRFKHICPYPHCGRRYQAEFGLLRHLGKYHLDQVELPRRKRSSLPSRHANHHRPASEERPGGSLGLCHVGETSSMEVIRHDFSPRPMVSGDIGTGRLNTTTNASMRLLQVEKNSLPRVPEPCYRLRIFPPDRIKASSNNNNLRSASLTEDSLPTAGPTASCYEHNGTSLRARSVSGDTQTHQQTLDADSQLPVDQARGDQHRHSSDGSGSLGQLAGFTSLAYTHPCRTCVDSGRHTDARPVSLSPPDGAPPASLSAGNDAQQTVANRQRTLSLGTESRHHLAAAVSLAPSSDFDHRSTDLPARTSVSDDECTRQMEFISGVHALTYSKNDSITCPIDGCDHVSSGRADLSAHLTGVHFPEVKNQLVRLIFACPVKDCPTVCDDEASFQVHFNRHLFGYLPSDLTDLFSALRSPGSLDGRTALASLTPVTSVSSAQPNLLTIPAGRVGTKAGKTSPSSPPPSTATTTTCSSSSSGDLEPRRLVNSDALSELLEPMPSTQAHQQLQQYSSGRVEWTPTGGARVRFGDDSFIEKEIGGLLSDGGTSELTDHGNLLSALDLIPDSLLMELLKEERPWWVEATNCPVEATSKDRTVVEANEFPPGRADASVDCVTSSAEGHLQTAGVSHSDLASSGGDGDSEAGLPGEGFAETRSHSHDSFFDSVNSLTSNSWVPSDVVRQTWSCAVANERPSTSVDTYLLTETSHGSQECPHNVLSDLTAALMLPDVERRLKMSMSARYDRHAKGMSSAGVAFPDLALKKASDMRNGRGVCCALKRRRNASESSPSSASPIFPTVSPARPCNSSLLPCSNGLGDLDRSRQCSTLKDDCAQTDDSASETAAAAGGGLVLDEGRTDSTCFSHQPSTLPSDYEDLSSSATASSNPLPHQVVVTPTVPPALRPTPSTPKVTDPGASIKKKYQPQPSRFDAPLGQTPSVSCEVFSREHCQQRQQPPAVERSQSLSIDTKKRKRRQQQQLQPPTPASIFPSALRVIAVAGRPAASLTASTSIGDEGFVNGCLNGTGRAAESTVAFDGAGNATGGLLLSGGRNSLIPCNSLHLPH